MTNFYTIHLMAVQCISKLLEIKYVLTGSIDLFVDGGKTINFSRDFITIFHNSFSSLFKTDLSQIWAYVLREPTKMI